MGLPAESVPNPSDRRMRKASLGRHRTNQPLRGILWRGAERALDHGGDQIVIDRSRSIRTGLISMALAQMRGHRSRCCAGRFVVTNELISAAGVVPPDELQPSRGRVEPASMPAAASRGKPRRWPRPGRVLRIDSRL